MKTTSKYTKAIVSIIAAVAITVSTALTDSVLSSLEIVTIAIAFTTAISVYLVPNLDGNVSRYAKGIIAFAGAGLAALSTILIDSGSVSAGDILTVVIAGLGAIGVVILPDNITSEVPEIDDSLPVEQVEFLM